MTGPTRESGFSPNPAENYERYFVPAIGRPMAEGLVEAAALRPGERVLDVACGTGVVARLAAERVGPDGEVAGLDPNPAMLGVARAAAPPDASIAWHEAPAEAIPLPDDSFDVATCGMGLQFFADRAGGLREIRRVLAPGGRFLASLPGPTPPPLAAMEQALARHVGPEAAGFVEAVFSLHDADEIRELATGAGFAGVEVRAAPRTVRLPAPETFLWQYLHSTPLAAAVGELDEDGRAALEADFCEGCEPFVEDGGITGPVRMTTLAARASARARRGRASGARRGRRAGGPRRGRRGSARHVATQVATS